MSIDYFPCSYCDETFADCSKYIVYCDCGKIFCCNECAATKSDNDILSCRICRNEYVPDGVLLQFALDRLSLTRDMAEQFYRNSIEQKNLGQ